MRRTQVMSTLLFCAAISVAHVGSAQDAARPTILNVTMDAAGDQLTITGSGFGAAPVVTIDGQPVPVLPGATDTQVNVVTPAVLLTSPGTYRLTMVDSVRQVGEVFVVASRAGSRDALTRRQTLVDERLCERAGSGPATCSHETVSGYEPGALEQVDDELGKLVDRVRRRHRRARSRSGMPQEPVQEWSSGFVHVPRTGYRQPRGMP